MISISNAKQKKKNVHDTLPIDDPSLIHATYRMTIDFRHLNRVMLNDHSTQLPSVQSIEVNFADSLVSTLGIANMFPSILLHESSRDYFNFYFENEILRYARLPQGWAPSLAIAQRAMIVTFSNNILQDFIMENNIDKQLFPYTHYHQFLLSFF